MKNFLLIIAGCWCLGLQPLTAQVAIVSAPSLEWQEAANHVESMRQAVQTYQTMVEVQRGIDKGIDAVEKINSKLTAIRDVQAIVSRSARCIKHIEKVYNAISDMKLQPRYITELLSQCTQVSRECVEVTAYGSKIFANNFLRMNDAERLQETRHVLDEIDKLVSRVNYIDFQARAIEFNNKMLNAYIH